MISGLSSSLLRRELATRKEVSSAPGMKLDIDRDWPHDGCFVGAGGQVFPADTALEKVPAILPDNGIAVKKNLIMVNGIMTDVALQASDLQGVANQGFRVVGIHNDTNGLFRDLAQCLGDKLDLEMADNRAVDTAERVIAQAISQDQPLHLLGHSQGALILSRALDRVRDQLKNDADDKLSKIEVTTIGGAAYTYPHGPHYRHVINHYDIVAMSAGKGLVSGVTGGSDDEVFRFSEIHNHHHLPPVGNGASNFFARFVDRTTHGPQDVYLPHLNPVVPALDAT
jgi:hypothetical protein